MVVKPALSSTSRHLVKVTGALVSFGSDVLPAQGSTIALNPTSGDATIVGVVNPGSELGQIFFRTPANTGQIIEGSLVRVPLRGETVLYQVVAANIRGERLATEAEHRFIEVSARKIGRWDESESRFRQVPWLPAPGSPVELEVTAQAPFDAKGIGCVPSSSYGVRVELDPLITHNAAILGILGVGKTYLAFEIVRRTLAAGKKVVVIDITGEYSNEFQNLFTNAKEAGIYQDIEAKIGPNHDAVSKNVEDGGNVQEFRAAIGAELAAFLDSQESLRIYNPNRFDVTRQDSKMFGGDAAIASLTVVETTRIVAEQLLEAMSQTMTTEARVLLVLEEAHSLVPEWNSTTYDGDQRASNGTAKAVLQGRKFGLGVLLVTQRTANVTKTILNQCHTVFAMRTFDETGMGFLSNYIGRAYAEVLSTLQERTAVIFGKASSCENPVIIRTNDHADVLDAFPLPEAAAEEPPDASAGPEDEDPATDVDGYWD